MGDRQPRRVTPSPRSGTKGDAMSERFRNLGEAARWTVRATHEGPLFGIAATGRRVTVTGIDIARVVDGKAVEHWRIFDQLGMLQQLGAIPASGAPPAN